MDNFRIIYKILRYLEKAMDYDETDMDAISPEHFGITQQRWNAIIQMLSEKRYIIVERIIYSPDRRMINSICEIRITLDGLNYLQENPLMIEEKEAEEKKKTEKTIVISAIS